MRDRAASLQSVDFAENYSSSGASLLLDFYVPALKAATSYDRAAGYFSSAVFALAPAVFSDFVSRGGKIRLLCSPYLSAADAEAILEFPETHRPSPLEIAVDSLTALVHGSKLEEKSVSCLRALIDAEVLEIRFVTVGREGLYHEKIGVFSDELGNHLSFSGSANETAAAWSGLRNHEGIEAFPSWRSESDSRRCNRHTEQFDETWLGLRRNLNVTTSRDAAKIIRDSVPSEPLEEIVEALKLEMSRQDAVSDAISLRQYQEDVLKSWEEARYKGIVTFATGGGKTRTALEAIRRWMEEGKPALILVPSELLHHQWREEIESMLSGTAVLLVGAGHGRHKWSGRLSDYTVNDPSLGQRIVLATYQTAATDLFLELVRGGSHLLVVADEVHRIGARDTRRFLEEADCGGRLGLSATPERFGDADGTDALFRYFGQTLQPEFTLRDALDARVLVPYDYSFRTCALNEGEQLEWNSFTERVAREIARNKGELTDHALHLLRQRARISKGAEAKASVARELIQTEYREGDRWLVYCGDVQHLKEVRSELEDLGIDLLEYHSKDDGDHATTLSFFTQQGGVMLAVKCLDEGIDIPLINKALILASSSNPREYVQRRGRVLRRSPGKLSAQLFDVIVTGDDGKAITPSEVARAMEFARDARNVGTDLYLERLLPEGRSEDGLEIEDS